MFLLWVITGSDPRRPKEKEYEMKSKVLLALSILVTVVLALVIIGAGKLVYWIGYQADRYYFVLDQDTLDDVLLRGAVIPTGDTTMPTFTTEPIEKGSLEGWHWRGFKRDAFTGSYRAYVENGGYVIFTFVTEDGVSHDILCHDFECKNIIPATPLAP